MTDARKEITTIAKDIAKSLNSYFAKQLKKHNINLDEDSLYNELFKEEIAEELIKPHPDDITHLTVILDEYIRRN